MNASNSTNLFTNSCDHTFTNGKAPQQSHLNHSNAQFLYSLWRRADAWNVSFPNLSRGLVINCVSWYISNIRSKCLASLSRLVWSNKLQLTSPKIFIIYLPSHTLYAIKYLYTCARRHINRWKGLLLGFVTSIQTASRFSGTRSLLLTKFIDSLT